jgi:hypothetical protein
LLPSTVRPSCKENAKCRNRNRLRIALDVGKASFEGVPGGGERLDHRVNTKSKLGGPKINVLGVTANAAVYVGTHIVLSAPKDASHGGSVPVSCSDGSDSDHSVVHATKAG